MPAFTVSSSCDWNSNKATTTDIITITASNTCVASGHRDDKTDAIRGCAALPPLLLLMIIIVIVIVIMSNVMILAMPRTLSLEVVHNPWQLLGHCHATNRPA